MPSYRELLLDPRWQRRRAEVLIRDDFTCQNCGSTTETLFVHHNYYEKNRMPWEYPSDDDWPHALETICEKCHPLRDEIRRIAKELVAIAIKIERGVPYA